MTIKNFKKILPHKFQGFTIIETLIAIAIISVGLGGVLGLVSYVISISRMSSTEIIAANLAQEGIEVIRNIRDSNWVGNKSWKKGIEGSPGKRTARVSYNSTDSSVQYINPMVGNPVACKAPPDADQCQLYLKDGFYSHDNTGEETNFRRLVRINKIGGQDRLRVRSIVAWQGRNGNWHQISVEDHLYDYEMPSPPVKYKWELTNPLEVKDCNGGLEKEEGGLCTIVASGKYHQQHKCGKCCFNAACTVFGTDFGYIAPWDINAYDFNPPLMISPDLPAFLGDKTEVCDIYEDSGVYKCRVFKKIAY